MADENAGGGGGPGELEEGPRPLNVVPLHPDPWLSPQWVLTHEAVVLEFKRLHGERFLYVERLGEVFHWTGHVWEADEYCTLPNQMAELCRRIGSALKKKTVRQKVEASSFISGCAGRARQLLTVPVERFDQAEVFNMRDATISLKANGSHAWQPRPQRREDYCTKIGGMTAAAGPCPMWLEFLAQITGGDQELIDYLQRVAGYCATPFTSEQAFFFFYGSGGNGKGAFLRTLAAVLGSYATTASLDLFLASKFEQHPEELAALRGMRLVVATETGEGRRWDESKIKAMSGGDEIRARFMRQNSFTYMPQFKIIVSGNDQPRIADTGPALRRRLQMVPFDIQVTPDGTFEARMLAAEAPAILAWVLDGYVAWRERGLDPPPAVLAATEEYFHEQDLVAQWLAECAITAEDKDADGAYTVSANVAFHGPGIFTEVLHRSYREWCKKSDYHPIKKIPFGRKLSARFGITEKNPAGRGRVRAWKTKHQNGFEGIILRVAEEADRGDPRGDDERMV